MDSHGRRVGVFIVSGSNINQVNKIIDKIYKTIRFKVSGKWYYGLPSSLNHQKSVFETINLM